MRAVRSREAINVFLQTDHLIASYRSLHVLPGCPLKAFQRLAEVCRLHIHVGWHEYGQDYLQHLPLKRSPSGGRDHFTQDDREEGPLRALHKAGSTVLPLRLPKLVWTVGTTEHAIRTTNRIASIRLASVDPIRRLAWDQHPVASQHCPHGAQ